ncbi:FixH family protein [Halalkalibacter krulwichiae]|uniref:YtkA-like domain-containing protein n=1 Tax=Halalkalibacter krulwichiae TaxID=199441 RepID=A0A1X9MER1_9BACI|nr:FixH family protein [Halalkalibacter krulwichiae]ARK31134.1 hypothetical protein BkAM31D_15465 [Halalkalibacter krulwichiae]
MKKFLILGTMFLLTACGGEGDNQHSSETVDQMEPIEVELLVPETADIEEIVTFESIVTQGDDMVEDANEVVYEIWKEGNKEESELIEAEIQEGHHYLLKYTFNEEGQYHVQTHVTARGLHRMPTTQIAVGDADDVDHEHEHEQNHEHAHHHADVYVDTKKDGDQLTLTIHVEQEPYSGGKVTLELRQATSEQTHWEDMIEVNPGTFEMQGIEKLDGKYNVTVHIVDDELHEHMEIELEF